MTKDAVRKLLWQNADSYVSGAELAKKLAVTRTAVWKAIEQLRAEGYAIESVTNRGYRLSSKSDVLSEEGLRRYLQNPAVTPRVYASISSTNTVLKTMAAEGAPEGLALIAGEQTAGRGRMGRSFYSPADSGLYLSLLLRPKIPAAEAVRITAAAAVAVCEAIEELSGLETQIKWVNDVLVAGKKVCGILTEAALDCESGQLNYAVVGIGINTAVPAGDFPPELRQIAGAIFGEEKPPELRCRLAASVLDRLMDCYARLEDPVVFENYRRRSLVPGKPINILAPGKEPEPALALDLAPDFGLLVRLPDGSTRKLNSGEVSVRAR